MIARSMTAEEFAEHRYELSDGGQWSELICGEAVSLHPPETAHGTVVLNLSKALADWIEQTRTGYACFELGLILNRCPDTVCCPPISYFVAGDRWAEMDKTITDSCPALVVEVPSTPDRTRLVPGRMRQYWERGVGVVWVVDPKRQSITVQTSQTEPLVLSSADTLSGGDGWIGEPGGEPVLAGFSLRVEQVFREPDWWSGRSGTSD
jgi:Uma2 family endonuclease